MLPFVIIFLVVGVVLLVVGRRLEDDARRSASWPVVVGKLEVCEVVERPGLRVEDLSTSALQVRYSYVVHGKTHHSTRYAFGYGDGSADEKHRAIANDLKHRAQLLVHYDPASPSEAVLNTEAQTNATRLGRALLVVAAVSALIGFAGHW